MTTLHMDTESVHSLSLDIRQKVEQMREQARSASDLGQSVDWMGPSRDEFIFDLKQLTQTIQTQLDAGLAEYETMYQKMKWRDKFSEEERLDAEIKRVSGLLPDRNRINELDQNISKVNHQIEEIEAKRTEAQARAKNFINNIRPDWPLQRDKEDGLPWRVKADDYEDEVAEYDRQLNELRNQSSQLSNEQQAIQANLSRLEDLNKRKAALENVIQQGIPADGPTDKWYKDGFGGCTNYVAGKRDLYISQENRIRGNAQDWRDSAIHSGWDVGKEPAKGSIMVFQGEASKTYGTANRKEGGHVAYVEGVEKTATGYKVTISEASTIYNKNGDFIPGIHTKVTTRTIEIPANGDKNIDFIYDGTK